MNFDIYTTGGIEFLSQVYKGVIMTFGDSSYETLLRLFGLFSIIFASIALIGKQQIDYLAKRVAILFLISGFSFGLRADVTIIDTKHNQTYVVSGAPWIPAYVHSLFSSASYQLTNIAQQVFHTGTVNVYEAAATGKNAWGSVNLDYNKTGFGGFFEYLNFFKNYRFNTTGITDLDKIYRKFHIALTECTINEIPLWPDNDFQKKVLLSSNLIQDLRPTVNGYVEFEGQPTDCIALYDSAIEDWNTIKSKFDTAGDPTLNLLAKLGITAMDSQKVQEANAEILQQGTVQLSDMIGQAGMTWALSDAWDSFLADQSPERAMVYKYEVGRNIEESKQMGRSLGLYAKETVPLMKIVFESMTIAFIPVTFLIILVSGGNVIRNSIFSFAWVYAWDPVLATINGIVNIAAIAKVKAALNAAAVYNNALNGDWMGYSIQAMNIMYSTLDYIPSVAGYLAISTPGIAYMLIKGGEMTMASIASMMAAPVMSTPTHVEAASSLETQKIANQTGKSFGQVEMQYNAAGQAKLNAMVFQGGVEKHGYNTFEKAGAGALDYDLGQKMGLGSAVSKYGVGGVSTATANLEAAKIGSGSVGDMDKHHHAGALDARKKLDFASQVKRDFAGPGGSYVETQDGNIRDVKLSNVDTKLEFSQRDSLTRSAAKDLAANEEFTRVLSENKDLSKAYGVDKRHSDTLRQSYDQNLSKEILRNKSFSDSIKTSTDQSLYGELKAGGKILEVIGIGGGYRITGTTSDGHEFSATISASDAQRFSEIRSKAAEDAIVKTASTKEGLGYVAQLSERVGASTAYRDLTAAQSDEAVSRKMAVDVGADILEYVRKTEFGHMDDVSYARERAVGKIQDWRENDPAKLNDVFKVVTDTTYNKLKPSDLGALTSEVKGEIKASEGLKIEAGTAADKAEAKTADVTEGKISTDPRIGIKQPNPRLNNAKHGSQEGVIDAKEANLAKNPIHMLQNAGEGPMNDLIESAKPLPLASQQEQERRLKQLGTKPYGDGKQK